MRKSLEKQIAETDEERKEREAFEKASSQEKIEKLRKCIDELGQRLDRHIWYMDEVVEKLEQKYGEVREDYRIVSTESILCKVREGEVHNAILLVHGGGIITVKCSAEFCYCKYGLLES
ncbi:MAG: hypothetical protein HYX85_02865 [Chloroflexi bacterium]|nr:hypothetical protein [Chloroflexota bacterium]